MSFAIGFLGYVLIFAVIAVLGFLLLKSILKAIAIAAGIMLVITIIIGVMVFSDVKEMSNKFQTENKLILLTDGNNALVGMHLGDLSQVSGTDFGQLIKDGKLSITPKPLLADYSSSLASKDYDKILADNYKVIIVDLKTFDSVQTIDFQGMQFSKDFIVSVIKSDTPVETLLTPDTIDRMAAIGMFKNIPGTPEQQQLYIEELKKDPSAIKESLVQQFGSEDAIKVVMLAAMAQSVIKDPATSTSLLIEEYQKGNIKIYKETIVFKMLNYMPISLVKIMAAKMQGSATASASS